MTPLTSSNRLLDALDQTRRTSALFLAAAACGLLACDMLASNSAAQDSFRPTDPIASIDGDPIFLGELNYLLISKLRVKDLSAIPTEVQRASCALLVRQHLAMKSLRQQGGQGLQKLLDEDWEAFTTEIRRQGLSIDEFCQRRMSDEKSVRHARDWDSAWRRYLKSKMTDANLKRFYRMHPEKYASAAWNVSHLFLPIDPDQPDSAEIGSVRVNQIAEELKAASDSPERLAERFAELARRDSEGATAREGGRIGWVSKLGDLPASVMAAIRDTPAGAVAGPVQSPMGHHLVLVHEKSVKEIPFEQIPDLAPLRRDASTALFDALVSQNEDATVFWYIKQLRPPTNE